jgi:clan AA aspartic protease
MGLADAKIILTNPKLPKLRALTVDALADTGAVYHCVPAHVAAQLQLEELQKKEVKTADGKTHLCPYVGPVQIEFDNRACFVGAMVLGDEVLLGAIPMEDMDLVVLRQTRRVAVNPLNPNFAAASAK